jgi:hypothetical protein
VLCAVLARARALMRRHGLGLWGGSRGILLLFGTHRMLDAADM